MKKEKLTKWAVWFEENEEITMLFDNNGDFVRFENNNDQERYSNDVVNWEVGNWKEFTIKGEY